MSQAKQCVADQAGSSTRHTCSPSDGKDGSLLREPDGSGAWPCSCRRLPACASSTAQGLTVICMQHISHHECMNSSHRSWSRLQLRNHCTLMLSIPRLMSSPQGVPWRRRVQATADEAASQKVRWLAAFLQALQLLGSASETPARASAGHLHVVQACKQLWAGFWITIIPLMRMKTAWWLRVGNSAQA